MLSKLGRRPQKVLWPAVIPSSIARLDRCSDVIGPERGPNTRSKPGRGRFVSGTF
jgi:hypothetical protein